MLPLQRLVQTLQRDPVTLKNQEITAHDRRPQVVSLLLKYLLILFDNALCIFGKYEIK